MDALLNTFGKRAENELFGSFYYGVFYLLKSDIRASAIFVDINCNSLIFITSTLFHILFYGKIDLELCSISANYTNAYTPSPQNVLLHIHHCPASVRVPR